MTTPVIGATAKPASETHSSVGAGEPLKALSNARDHVWPLTWVLTGKLTLMGSNAALMLLLTYVMELTLYGVFVAAISGQLLLSRLLLLGVDSGMIRLRGLPELREQSGQIVRAGLSVIFYGSGVFALILAVLWVISFWVPVALWLAGSIFAGALGSALVDYSYCYRLSELQYRAAGQVQSGTGIGRLLLTGAAILLIPEAPRLVFLVYPAVSLVSGLGLTVALTRKNRLRPDPGLIRRLLRFSLWLGAANVTGILGLYVCTFLLVALGLEAENGIFGLCLTLSMGFFAICNAYGEYISPRMARLVTVEELRHFLPRALGLALAIVAACVPIVIAVGVTLPRILPPEFAGISPTFYLLAASMLLLIVQSPFQNACVQQLRPHLVVIGWMLRVLIAGLICVALAGRWGAFGAAVAQLGASILALVAFAVFAIVGLRSAAAARIGEQQKSSR